MTGGDGDDWIVGGDGLYGEQYLYGDSANRGEPYFDELAENDPWFTMTDTGSDTIYGGDYTYDQFIVGGYGDDKLFGGHNNQESYVKIWGDWKEGTIPSDHPGYG